MPEKKEFKRKTYQKEYQKEYAKKHKEIRIRLTSDEYELIHPFVEQEGLSLAGFFKLAGFMQAKGLLRLPNILTDELSQLKRILRGEGNNINQIARHANETHELPQNIENILFDILKNQEERIMNFERIIQEKIKF